MEEGKVLCPNCKGQKIKEFTYKGSVMERICLTCDDNGMIWWIDKIINPRGFPWGYMSEGEKGKDFGQYVVKPTLEIRYKKKRISRE